MKKILIATLAATLMTSVTFAAQSEEVVVQQTRSSKLVKAMIADAAKSMGVKSKDCTVITEEVVLAGDLNVMSTVKLKFNCNTAPAEDGVESSRYGTIEANVLENGDVLVVKYESDIAG